MEASIDDTTGLRAFLRIESEHTGLIATYK